MAWSSIVRATDPEAFIAAVQGTSGIEVVPTAKGNFDTEITKVRFDRLWMQRFHSSLPQVITCEHPSDRQVNDALAEASLRELVKPFHRGKVLRETWLKELGIDAP